jgi:hypothetical protein
MAQAATDLETMFDKLHQLIGQGSHAKIVKAADQSEYLVSIMAASTLLDGLVALHCRRSVSSQQQLRFPVQCSIQKLCSASGSTQDCLQQPGVTTPAHPDLLSSVVCLVLLRLLLVLCCSPEGVPGRCRCAGLQGCCAAAAAGVR